MKKPMQSLKRGGKMNNYKMTKNLYEVVLSSKLSGNYSTVIIESINLENAEKKVNKRFDLMYLIHDVHLLKK